jgi:hypothetical protein
MPLDPSISLGATGAVSAPPINPLDMVGKFATIQNQINQNQLFQQTFAARKAAGQILATSPDMESAISELQKNPLTGPFAADTIASLRASQLALTQVQGEQQKQAKEGLDGVLKGVGPSLLTDPSQFSPTVDAFMKTLSPSAEARVRPAIESLKQAWTSNLPSDPAQAKSMFTQRVMGTLTSSGYTPEMLSNIIGKPMTQDTGGGVAYGTQAPAQLGGGFTPANGLAKTLAPTTVTGPSGPGGATTTKIIGGGNPLAMQVPGAGSDGTVLAGPTQAQAEYNTGRTKDIIDHEKNLDDNVKNGAQLRKNVSEVVDAMKSATTGGGAETYTKLGSLLQAIGVKNETVDKWANGSLAKSQVIDKVALQNSMSQLKQQLTGVGGSRLNAQEFVAYLNKNPNLTTDPRAALEVFNLWQKFYDRDKVEQQMLDKFKAGKPTGDKGIDSASPGQELTRWPALFQQSDYMKDFAPGGPISSEGVKGMDSGKISDSHKAALLEKYKTRK